MPHEAAQPLPLTSHHVVNSLERQDAQVDRIPLSFTVNNNPLPPSVNLIQELEPQVDIPGQISLLYEFNRRLPDILTHSAVIVSPTAIRFPSSFVNGNRVEHGALIDATLLRSDLTDPPSIRVGYLFYSFYPLPLEGNNHEIDHELVTKHHLIGSSNDEPTHPNSPAEPSASANELPTIPVPYTPIDPQLLESTDIGPIESVDTDRISDNSDYGIIASIHLQTLHGVDAVENTLAMLPPTQEVRTTETLASGRNGHSRSPDDTAGDRVLQPASSVLSVRTLPPPSTRPFLLRQTRPAMNTISVAAAINLRPRDYLPRPLKRPRLAAHSSRSPSPSDSLPLEPESPASLALTPFTPLLPTPSTVQTRTPDGTDAVMLDADLEDLYTEEEAVSVEEGRSARSDETYDLYFADSDTFHDTDSEVGDRPPHYASSAESRSIPRLAPSTLPRSNDPRVKYFEVRTLNEDMWFYNDANSTMLRQHGVYVNRPSSDNLPIMITPAGISVPPLYPGEHPVRIHTETIYSGSNDNHPLRFRDVEIIRTSSISHGPISGRDEEDVASIFIEARSSMGDDYRYPYDPSYHSVLLQRQLNDEPARPRL
jgi:hypothetical protein